MSDFGENVVSPSDPGGRLVLEHAEASEKERRRQETMQFYGATTLREFAGRFGMTGSDPEKTLKRWLEKGRGVNPPDLPPFHRPAELAAWWRRMQEVGVMGKKPPDWMVELEQAAAGAPVGAPGPAMESVPGAAAVVGSAAAASDHTPDFELPMIDGDASDGERQLLEFAKGWQAEMESARRAKDSKRFFRAWAEYKSLIKELRAWQKDRQRERIANGELMEAEKEKEALGIIFAAMGKTFTAAIDAVFAVHRPDLDASDRRREVLPYRDKIFAALKGTRFQQAVPREELERFLAA